MNNPTIWLDRIREFLLEHRDELFTRTQLRQELEVVNMGGTNVFNACLDWLVKVQLIGKTTSYPYKYFALKTWLLDAQRIKQEEKQEESKNNTKMPPMKLTVAFPATRIV